jgi:photosynthetic reaction center cytochrome c subunit
MTAWVSPEEGCGYCHNVANFADDSKYTKVVARRMLEMTQNINENWKTHVADTGVTCWTCHRGQPVPSNVWFKADHAPRGADFIGDRSGQNEPLPVVNLSSLPNDPFTPFLLQDKPIRVNGDTALPTGNRASIKQAEWTYGLMTHMSTGLGVNCTYCHNTQNFAKWEGGPPQRVTAWHGIRMVRDLNVAYMEPLTPVFPAHRKGDLGDVAKANCATCHQGAYKPLNGQSMLKDYPELAKLAATSAKAAASAPATKTAAK